MKKTSKPEKISKKEKINNFLEEEVNLKSKKDIITIVIILLLYTILTFYKLGDIHSINTFYDIDNTKELIFKLDKNDSIYTIKYYTGDKDAKFKLYALKHDEYKYVDEYDSKGVFTWNEIKFAIPTDTIKLEFTEDSTLGEVAFYDIYKRPISYTTTTKKLNDEKEYVPDKLSHMNSTYFDEIYFAKTAYEYVNNKRASEWTHPPLGKFIQAIPIYLTNNMSPFNYRFMSNISGILIVGVMYVFGAIYFKKRKYAILSSIIMSLETLHFAQTRMGTVDPHLVLFILVANMFMVLFVKEEKIKYLLLSGIFFALSVSVKWTGLYGGISLAIIYFNYLIKNKKINYKYIGYGTLFFVVIPLIFYISLFYLYQNNYYKTDSISNIIKENEEMYNYHSNLNAEHFFSSKWYTWPIDYKPVWFYVQDKDNNRKETISNIGNLIIWICSIFAMIYSLIKIIKKKDKDCFYIMLTVLALWLPYAFIGRVMFLYHYYPVIPFMILSLTDALKDIIEKTKLKWLVPVFLLYSLTFFIAYFPVVSGVEANSDYIEKLKLFDTWYF